MITAKKLSETWLLTDGENRLLVTLRKDFSFDKIRIRIRDEAFINSALKTLTTQIPV